MTVEVTTRVLGGTNVICQNGPLSNSQIDNNFIKLAKAANDAETRLDRLESSSGLGGTVLSNLKDGYNAYSPVKVIQFTSEQWQAGEIGSEDMGFYCLEITKEDPKNSVEGVFQGSYNSAENKSKLVFVDVEESASTIRLRALSGFSGYLYLGGLQTTDVA